MRCAARSRRRAPLPAGAPWRLRDHVARAEVVALSLADVSSAAMVAAMGNGLPITAARRRLAETEWRAMRHGATRQQIEAARRAGGVA